MLMKIVYRRSVFIAVCLLLASLIIFTDVYRRLRSTYPEHRNSVQSHRGEHKDEASNRRIITGSFHKAPWSNHSESIKLSSRKEKPLQQSFTAKDQQRTPVHHVAFLKVHKAASTSVQNIFYRYGYYHNLAVAQPVGTTGLRWPGKVERKKFHPPAGSQTTFDIMCVHATYTRKAFDQLLPKDSVYIGIVREPFKQFSSNLNYYHQHRVLGIPGPNPVRTFLLNERNRSILNPNVFNTQSRDLGFPVELISSKYDSHRFLDFLLKLDRELDLVMIVERFDESLILMRRLLKWDIKDVITGKLNSKAIPSRFQFGSTEEMLLKQISLYDYALYDFFKKKFQDIIDQQSPDFHEELSYFRQVKKKYQDFCLSLRSYDVHKVLWFEGSTWNEPFNVTNTDCTLLYIKERQFSLLLKTKMGYHLAEHIKMNGRLPVLIEKLNEKIKKST